MAIIKEGVERRVTTQRRWDIAVAWNIAALSRSDKLPPLESILPSLNPTAPRRPRSRDSVAKGLYAAMHGYHLQYQARHGKQEADGG